MKPSRIRLRTEPLELYYDPSNHSLYINGLELIPEIRRLNDLFDVIYDKEFYMRANKEMPLYYMYRGVVRDGDRGLCKSYGLRFDVTIIPPFMLGEEYVKTLGHCHSEVGKGITYPELYEVLQGRADFLLQRWVGDQSPSDLAKIKDVILLRASEGERILIPPNYGHITINPSGAALILANWVSSTSKSLYEPYKRMGGGAYFELAGGRFIPNARYECLPPLRLVRAYEAQIPQLPEARNIYEAFIRHPECLKFLNDPKFMETSLISRKEEGII
ncbi:glucose-6-phosphate isomerase [Candidatus Bathyarchaeota archaeon]|nr:glucose-6-phosphate isomerase [Candidatus Bathyarchaeota archaeon]